MCTFDRDPTDWRDLQQMVAQMFSEMGCDVRVSEHVKMVRGAKEIDVFVRDGAVTPPAVYLCECKFWKRAVPQETAHSFRTVVADFGANRGYIISAAGFQRGAYEATANTNVELVTFAQLMDMFCDRWRIAMGYRFMPFADALFPYWDPTGGRRPRNPWSAAERERHRQLMEAYLPFIQLGPTSENERFVRRFPIVLPRVRADGVIEGELTISSYREYYDFLEANKELALYQFRLLHGETD